MWTLESLKKFHFNGVFLSKLYILWAKKVQRSYLSWKWRGIQNLERDQLVVSKLAWGIWQILTWTLNFWTKYILLELKKYREVISHDIEEWCKTWRKIDLLIGKWKEFDKFSPEHLKVSKLELSWDPIVQSRKCMSSKFTEKLCVIQWRMKQKLKRNWLVVLKLTWGTSQILTRAFESLKNLSFNWLLVTKVYIVWATKVQRSYLSWHWRDMQILKKNWLVVWKKTWEICQIFTRALESVKTRTLMGSFCTKYKRYDLKICREVMCHDNEE